jgi:fermentation-respiration switch protein FrsA (DUF1100 family)
VTCPTLVITSDHDSIVPVSHTKAVYEAAPEPKRLLTIPGTDHNDFDLLAGERMIDVIVEFVRASVGTTGTTGPR